MSALLLSSRPTPLAGADQSALAAMAVEAYRAGRFNEAFALIDRACRTFAPSSEHLRLRAALRLKFSDISGCYSDLREAARLRSPDLDGYVLLMEMAERLGKRADCLRYAEPVLLADNAQDYRERCLQVLARVYPMGFGWCETADGHVIMHLRWNGQPSVRVEIGWNERFKLVDVRTQQPGSLFAHHATVQWSWPAGVRHFSMRSKLPMAGQIHTRRSTDNRIEVINRPAPAQAGDHGAERIHVIIPVYRDFAATMACIESALRYSDARANIIVVDDASPEPALRAAIRSLAEAGQITGVIRHRNGGFIAAVESGLDVAAAGDVVLLNADTLVPPNWLADLAAAAYADEAIGTVTPLSNNGELTSFPVPFMSNPLPSPEHLAVLSALAREVNGHEVVDIPNGVGFCLYIKRACLDSAGSFGSPFLKSGYFEDVDFTLRVAMKGFRNVCATGLVVGHSGSASYLQRKRSFVLQNMDEITRRYPDLSHQTNWFIARDPLKGARERILKALPAAFMQADTLVFISAMAEEPFYEHLLGKLGKQPAGVPITVRTFSAHPHLVTVTIQEPVAFSLTLDLRDAAEKALVMNMVQVCGARQAMVLLLSPLPSAMLELINCTQLPLDLAVLDETALSQESGLSELVSRAAAIHPGNAKAGGRLRALMRAGSIRRRRLSAPLMAIDRRFIDMRSAPPGAPLAVIPLDSGSQAWRAVEALALALRRQGDGRLLIMPGPLMNADALLRIGNIIVPGDVAAQEWHEVFQLYGCGMAVMIGSGHAYYDERLLPVEKWPLPLAAPAAGILAELVTGPLDLAIAPQSTPREAAEAVITWCHTLTARAPAEPHHEIAQHQPVPLRRYGRVS